MAEVQRQVGGLAVAQSSIRVCVVQRFRSERKHECKNRRERFLVQIQDRRMLSVADKNFRRNGRAAVSVRLMGVFARTVRQGMAVVGRICVVVTLGFMIIRATTRLTAFAEERAHAN